MWPAGILAVMNKSHRPSTEEWRQIIDGQRASGLTVAAYCLERGITQGSFYTWKRRLRAPARPTRSPKPAFVEVTPPRAKKQLICWQRAWWPDCGDPFQPDQHLPPARHRSPALPDAIADELAGYADQPNQPVVAGPVEAAELRPVRVGLSLMVNALRHKR